MAFYEGIALIQEKQAVVLDLGTDYTKFGFTGEASPRCIVRSEFWDAATRKYKRVHDYSSAEELYDNLVNMLHLLFFRHVLVNPKERRVLVVESLLTPTAFRDALAQVLFTHYEVGGAVWADAARLSAAALGAPVALVVCVGALEAEVTAVVHGSAVLRALEAAPLGARALHAELARLLDHAAGAELQLPDHVIEDIKVKTCFVTSRARALQWESPSPPAPARGVRVPVAGRAPVLVSGEARELAAEVMFRRDLEQSSLGDLILRSIARAPRDCRRALAANLVLTGGGARLAGLLPRLRDELHALLQQEPYVSQLFVTEFKFHSPPAHPNSVAWCGGAAAGAALCAGGAGGAGGGARVVSRDAYARAPRLRDWTCLLDNTPPDHPHRRLLDM